MSHLLARPRVPNGFSLAILGLVVAGAVMAGVVVGGLGADRPDLLLAAILATATLAVLIVWPEAALPVALFLLWSNTGSVAVGNGVPYALAAAIPLIIVVQLVVPFLRGDRFSIDRTFALMIGLLVVLVASASLSSYPATGMDRVVSLASEGIVVYLLVYNAGRTPAALARSAWALVAAGAFLAFVTVVQNVTQTFDQPYLGFSILDRQYFVGKSDVARAHGPLADPNYYAQLLVASIGLGLGHLRGERSACRRMLLVAALLLMAVAVAFTYSRGAVLALAVIATTMMLLGILRVRHVGLLAVAVAALIMIVPGWGERVASIGNVGGLTADPGVPTDADLAARSRATENLAALLVTRDHPVFGVGPGAFPFYYQEYARRTGLTVHTTKRNAYAGTAAGELPTRAAHNLFLGAAAETGIAGLLLLVAVLWASFAGLIHARRRLLSYQVDLGLIHTINGLLLALVGYVVAGLFLTLAFERYLWVLVALASAAAAIARRVSGRGRRGRRAAG